MYITLCTRYKASSYEVLFGILPKELRTAKEGVYVGEDSKIVYPKLSTIKKSFFCKKYKIE